MVIIYKYSEPKTVEKGDKRKYKVLVRTLSYLTFAGKKVENVQRQFRKRDPDVPMSKSFAEHVRWTGSLDEAKRILSQYRYDHRKSANPKPRKKKTTAASE